MTLPEVLKAIENSSTFEVKEVLSNISQKSGASIREISQELTKVAEALSKINICLYTPEGNFRKVADILEDIDSNSSNKKENNLLRSETLETTENSNQKSDFKIFDRIEDIENNSFF